MERKLKVCYLTLRREYNVINWVNTNTGQVKIKTSALFLEFNFWVPFTSIINQGTAGILNRAGNKPPRSFTVNTVSRHEIGTLVRKDQ